MHCKWLVFFSFNARIHKWLDVMWARALISRACTTLAFAYRFFFFYRRSERLLFCFGIFLYYILIASSFFLISLDIFSLDTCSFCNYRYPFVLSWNTIYLFIGIYVNCLNFFFFFFGFSIYVRRKCIFAILLYMKRNIITYVYDVWIAVILMWN